MKFRKQKRHVMDLLFTLGLFAVFAILSLLIVMVGAGVYQSTTARMEENYTTRTTLSYITEKLHQHDRSGGIRMTSVEGVPAISMEESIDGVSYTTYIYYYDGNVCELFTATRNEPTCRRGTPVLEAAGLEIEEIGEQCYRLTVTDGSGRTAQTFVRPVSRLAK